MSFYYLEKIVYKTSGAGRGHPPAWLSSYKLGRAPYILGALADAVRRFGGGLKA